MNKDELLEISKNFFGSVFQVENVSEKIRNLTYREVKKVFSAHDPRDLDCIVYPYEVLFTLIFLASLAGCKTKDDIFNFWKFNKQHLENFFPELYGCIPSTSTITRARNLIAANVMQEKMTAIFGELYNKIKVKQNAISAAHTNIAQQSLAMRDVLGCDGQEMKATARRLPNDERQTAFQITSIVSYNTGMTLGQVIHHKKNQEKTAILELSESINIEGSILTWDAINTTSSLIDSVVARGADVFVSLKSNQPHLYEECIDAYNEYSKGNKLYKLGENAATGSYSYVSGGKYFEKSIVVLKADDCISSDLRDKWKSIQSIAFIHTTTNDLTIGETKTSFRVYISSIPLDLDLYPNESQEMIQISLKRWCVETNHYHLDRAFDQDGDRYEEEDAAYCSTIMSKLIMSIFNFAKNAYNNEEMRYKGVATTSNLQMMCLDINFSMLLAECFFANDPKKLVNHELSRKYKFMKTPEPPKETDRGSSYNLHLLKDDNCGLANFLKKKISKKSS